MLATDIDGRRHLRSARRGLLDVPRVELSTYGRRSFSYAGPSAWNALPDYLKNSTLSLSVFRKQLKHFLFSSYWHIYSAFEVITETRYINYLLTYRSSITYEEQEDYQIDRGLVSFNGLVNGVRKVVAHVAVGAAVLVMSSLPRSIGSSDP